MPDSLPSPAPVTSGAAPAKSNNVVLTTLAALAVVAVLSVLVIWAGLVLIGRNVKVRVHQDDGRQAEVSIKTPLGGIDVNKSNDVSETTLGLPLYPGAIRLKDEGSASVRIGLPDSAEVHVAAAKFETPDPVGKVEAFYRGRLASQITHFVQRDHDGKTVFEIKNHGQERVVALESTVPGTRISLIRVGGGTAEVN